MSKDIPWYEKPNLLAFLALVLPLVALYGLSKAGHLPKPVFYAMLIAIVASLLGQLAVVMLAFATT